MINKIFLESFIYQFILIESILIFICVFEVILFVKMSLPVYKFGIKLAEWSGPIIKLENLYNKLENINEIKLNLIDKTIIIRHRFRWNNLGLYNGNMLKCIILSEINKTTLIIRNTVSFLTVISTGILMFLGLLLYVYIFYDPEFVLKFIQQNIGIKTGILIAVPFLIYLYDYLCARRMAKWLGEIIKNAS